MPSTDDATRKLRSGSREPLLRAEGLCVRYDLRQGLLRRKVGEVPVLESVDLRLLQGQTTAVVGESGSGKTTLSRAILRALPLSSGRVLFEGKDLHGLRRAELRSFRRLALCIAPAEPSAGELLPRLRAGLALEPKLVILDAVLDDASPALRSAVADELRPVQDERGVTCLVLSRKLEVATGVADEVAVLLAGRIVETGSSATLGARPQHPYTQHLVTSARLASGGGPATPRASISTPGCRFGARCARAWARCASDEPSLFAVPGGTCRCFLYDPGHSGA